MFAGIQFIALADLKLRQVKFSGVYHFAFLKVGSRRETVGEIFAF